MAGCNGRWSVPAVHLAEYPTCLAWQVLAVFSGHSGGLSLPWAEGVSDPGGRSVLRACPVGTWMQVPGDFVRFPEKGLEYPSR